MSETKSNKWIPWNYYHEIDPFPHHAPFQCFKFGASYWRSSPSTLNSILHALSHQRSVPRVSVWWTFTFTGAFNTAMKQVARITLQFYLHCCLLLTVYNGATATRSLKILPAQPIQEKAIGDSMLLTCNPDVPDRNLISDFVWRDNKNRTVEKSKYVYLSFIYVSNFMCNLCALNFKKVIICESDS